jgi:hypothetical protein
LIDDIPPEGYFQGVRVNSLASWGSLHDPLSVFQPTVGDNLPNLSFMLTRAITNFYQLNLSLWVNRPDALLLAMMKAKKAKRKPNRLPVSARL